MSDPKGDILYVNLGASQTRRRLKSFGHGVRKVQSVGTGQSAVIHTATGGHLDELKAKFNDVGYSVSADDLGEPLESLRNLGQTSAAWLREVGVQSVHDLESLGPVAAFRLVQNKRPEVSLNLLWAIVAGLSDRDWRDLSDEEKEALRRDMADEHR